LQALVDTTGLWGLIFEDSKYHDYIIENLEGKNVVVLSIQLLELFIIVYREFSEYGKKPQKGLEKLLEILTFLTAGSFEKHNIKLKYQPTTSENLMEALFLIIERPDIFRRRGPKETTWLEFIDAVLAVFWKKTKMTLYTCDRNLIEFGKENNLEYQLIKSIS